MTLTLRSVNMALHPEGEGVSDGIRRTGDFYEAAILDYIHHVHPAHKTIVDAGANIGNHTLYFAMFLAHDRIHAFEPVPANYDLLAQNVGWLPTVAIYPTALSDEAKTLTMALNPGNMGACLVQEGGPVEVEAITLDSLDLRDVTFLKIDVEDHEAQVLLGARHTIARDHPLILIEDWSFGGAASLLPGYVLEKEWREQFTYLYRWQT